MMNKKPMFDFVIGNPPYQDSCHGESRHTPPLYHHFIDASQKIGEQALLITPGRFLFNAGATPKEWNRKILSNEHFTVAQYMPSSADCFPTTDIKGGIAITHYNKAQSIGPIGTFVPSEMLQTIMQKVVSSTTHFLTEIIYTQNRYNLTALYAAHPEVKEHISGDGKDQRLRSNAFERVPLFTDTAVNSSDVQILGVISNKRIYKFFPLAFLNASHENLYKYKVLVPSANGSGTLGETIATPLIGSPLIGSPLIGYTDTFIGIGSFESQIEAEAALKYIKSKFCRAMVGVCKTTQSNTREVWRCVPLQNFTEASDIDWSQSVADIDKQLYTKYGLSQDEIDFIESHVKEME